MEIEIDWVEIERVRKNKFLGFRVDDWLESMHQTIEFKVSRDTADIHKAKKITGSQSTSHNTVHCFCHIYITGLSCLKDKPYFNKYIVMNK